MVSILFLFLRFAEGLEQRWIQGWFLLTEAAPTVSLVRHRPWDFSVWFGGNCHYSQGFSDSSVGKETACNAEDPSSIPGLGRSLGEGIDYPLHYSWVSLGAQLVKKPPAMWETWARSLGWEDPWRRERLPTLLFWRIPWTQPMGSQRVRHDWVTLTCHLSPLFPILCDRGALLHVILAEDPFPDSMSLPLIYAWINTKASTCGVPL